ncbi:MAG: NAD(P)/FAD-dependent oxidoreductase [Pseudomonadota bacterium]
MKTYDSIVVGGGASGLTAALILAMNGHKVLLLEKHHSIGGALSRFYRKGIPFDTGFHFTGGLQAGGLLCDILSVLGMREFIEPVFLAEDYANRVYFELEGRFFEIPYGIPRMRKKFGAYFPEEAAGIDRYFERVKHVCQQTPSMDIRNLSVKQGFLKEDLVTLQEVLDGIISNNALKALISGFAMCYGVKPDEVSFATHSRICAGLYESVARVKDGGDAFIKAFKTRFSNLDIEISCSTYIAELADIRERRVGRFILNTGEEISASNCVFTIHPKEILKILPEACLTKAFRQRVSSFESSAGFFAVFASLDQGFEEKNFDTSIVSIFPHDDVNRMLDPACAEPSALVLVKTTEQRGPREFKSITTFEPSFFSEVDAWNDSKTGVRPQEYKDYKQKKTEEIIERIVRVFPEYKSHLKVFDSASVLTFRDYLSNYDGAAYGVKQKAAQFNLFGRLPLKNLYAAGQSSLLPGIIGAMMSSFMVARAIVEEDRYCEFISRGSGN